MPRNLAIQLRDTALRQIIGLDFFLQRQPRNLRNQSPVSADHATQQTGMRQAIEAPLLPVALSSSKDQRQVARASGLHIALGQGRQQFIRRAVADKARVTQHIAITQEGYRLLA